MDKSPCDFAIMKQPEELVDFAWVSLDEVKNYDMIDNIYEQIEKVDRIFKEKN